MKRNLLAVVSGASRGIGKALVRKFASEGFDIAACARNWEDLAILKTEIEQEFPESKIYTYTADVSSKTEVKVFADFIKSLKIPLEVLVNNAGKFIPGAIYEEKEDVLEKLMQTNLYSAYFLTKSLISEFMQQKSGHIFNICSVASFMAYPNGGSYAISKHALLGFSRCLREEMKPYNVRVTSVMPGATLTDSWEGINLPSSRFATPEDIAEIVYASYALSKNSVVEEIVIRPQLGDI
ncbi:MAG: SDR family oxidoreductase [Cytophagales bacterium]|nr:SDR family oxidoreductase [Cytophagales bacterium]MDW8383447.1 SDR family oxidoreductase [Flammeovirgaceae bacterium]